MSRSAKPQLHGRDFRDAYDVEPGPLSGRVAKMELINAYGLTAECVDFSGFRKACNSPEQAGFWMFDDPAAPAHHCDRPNGKTAFSWRGFCLRSQSCPSATRRMCDNGHVATERPGIPFAIECINPLHPFVNRIGPDEEGGNTSSLHLPGGRMVHSRRFAVRIIANRSGCWALSLPR